MLPNVIRTLILAYHDRYGLVEKRKRMHFQIRGGYRLWMRHMSARGSSFHQVTEYAAKLWLRRHPFYPPYYNAEWQQHLFYFKLALFLSELYDGKPGTPAELTCLLPL